MNREDIVKFYLGLLILFFSLNLQAKFVTGVGYIQPADYRVDNDVSPLPLGWNVVPMIGYFGERLRIVGPKISYVLIKNPFFNFFTFAEVLGDRYKSQGIGLRDSAINMGVGVRIVFITIKYGHDITNRYKGHSYEISGGWRFFLSNDFFLTPSYKMKFYSDRYVNKYFGVSNDEAKNSPYSSYIGDDSVNHIWGIGGTYKLDELQSFALNLNWTFLDVNIYSSPTVSKKSYPTYSLFWNFSF